MPKPKTKKILSTQMPLRMEHSAIKQNSLSIKLKINQKQVVTQAQKLKMVSYIVEKPVQIQNKIQIKTPQNLVKNDKRKEIESEKSKNTSIQ